MVAEDTVEDIGGEVFTEQDLADNTADLLNLTLPDGVDQGWLLKALFDDLRRGEHAQAVAAEAETRRVIELNQRLEHRMVPGLGQLVARVPLSVYTHWTARYGAEFWQDPDSVEFLLKRAGGGQGNPGFKIQTKGRPTVIVDGLRDRNNSAEEEGSVPSAGHTGGGVKPAGADMAPAVPRPSSPVKGRRGRWALAPTSRPATRCV